MKYIRTKDGVYEIKGANLITKSFTIYKGKRQCFVKEKDIIKQAETIEELCDEYVVVYNESKKFKKPFTSFYEDKIGVLKEHDLNECKIYGAIWADKGLIYVAKMNEKGELELL